jgi:hypothetical protein
MRTNSQHPLSSVKVLFITASIYIMVLFATNCLLGCKEDTSTNSTSTSTPPPTNVPLISIYANNFNFLLDANSYSSNLTYDLSFLSDTLSFNLTVTNQSSGNASLIILDPINSIVYSDSLLINKGYGFTRANKGIPKQIKLAFNNYTGTVFLWLSHNK